MGAPDNKTSGFNMLKRLASCATVNEETSTQDHSSGSGSHSTSPSWDEYEPHILYPISEQTSFATLNPRLSKSSSASRLTVRSVPQSPGAEAPLPNSTLRRRSYSADDALTSMQSKTNGTFHFVTATRGSLMKQSVSNDLFPAGGDGPSPTTPPATGNGINPAPTGTELLGRLQSNMTFRKIACPPTSIPKRAWAKQSHSVLLECPTEHHHFKKDGNQGSSEFYNKRGRRWGRGPGKSPFGKSRRCEEQLGQRGFYARIKHALRRLVEKIVTGCHDEDCVGGKELCAMRIPDHVCSDQPGRTSPVPKRSVTI